MIRAIWYPPISRAKSNLTTLLFSLALPSRASKPLCVIVVDARKRSGGYAYQGWDIILTVVGALKKGWVILVIVVDTHSRGE